MMLEEWGVSIDDIAGAIAITWSQDFANLSEENKENWRRSARAAYEAMQDAINAYAGEHARDAIRDHEECQ